MFTDMVGYTALGQRNEALSLALVEEQRKVIRPILARHNGREVKTMGDAFLVEFPNTVDAVRCAYDIQRAIREYNFTLEPEKRIHLRIGVHVGEVVESQGDISGDAVNVASRIEQLAEDGGVCLTKQVHDHVKSKVDLPLLAMGPRTLKNVSEPVEVYRIGMPWGGREEDFAVLDGKRVAVLPFANMSPDPADEYLADGLTEELISTVSKIGELSVVSRTSVMQYKGKPISIGEIGKHLMAGTILEGSVRKAGSRIRVTVQAVDASLDRHLWAESYDRELQDVFAIQSDIAERVASSLKVQLLSSEKEAIERKPTENIEAYKLFLRGRFHFYLQSRVGFDKALECYREALNLDPAYAYAFVGLSDAYHIGSHWGFYSPEEAYPRMKELAVKALEINPGLAEGHASLGAVYFHYEWRWKEAEEEFMKAIELKPNYLNVYEMYSWLLAVLGRDEESAQVIRRAALIPPEYPSVWLRVGYNWGGGSLRLGSAEQVVEMSEKLVKSNPEFAFGHDCLGFAYYRASRTAEAISELKMAVELSRGDSLIKGDLALLHAFMGEKAEAEAVLKELQSLSGRTYVSNVSLACILFALGRRDEAFENLEEAYERKAIDLPDVRKMPEMNELRADPRWIYIETQMGLPRS